MGILIAQGGERMQASDEKLLVGKMLSWGGAKRDFPGD